MPPLGKEGRGAGEGGVEGMRTGVAAWMRKRREKVERREGRRETWLQMKRAEKVEWELRTAVGKDGREVDKVRQEREKQKERTKTTAKF
ncbi:hypothetical protein LTS18_004539 [Coniosporium uncinatum]|uniref:Uncharacterized protein n=1 Tax=Coniosporium uncinatum TaxID=93489 RepID=A0ACC3D5K4_9PEZI|nr:hypothetical protein LTS18_004539 [Coniosporium uncinatum]